MGAPTAWEVRTPEGALHDLLHRDQREWADPEATARRMAGVIGGYVVGLSAPQDGEREDGAFPARVRAQIILDHVAGKGSWGDADLREILRLTSSPSEPDPLCVWCEHPKSRHIMPDAMPCGEYRCSCAGFQGPERPSEPDGDGWLPTPENVNALPEPIRRYVHDLEARSDPAGDVRNLTIARDTIRALEAERDASPSERASTAADGGWRSMDTAPKDGTEILAHVEGAVTMIVWMTPTEMHGPAHPEDAQVHEDPQWWEWFGAPLDAEPTHWMPLPTPPDSAVDEPAPVQPSRAPRDLSSLRMDAATRRRAQEEKAALDALDDLGAELDAVMRGERITEENGAYTEDRSGIERAARKAVRGQPSSEPEPVRKALEDLCNRAERARRILSKHGNWGMLDTRDARKALAHPSPSEPECDCWKRDHQVCDVCQGVSGPSEPRGETDNGADGGEDVFREIGMLLSETWDAEAWGKLTDAIGDRFVIERRPDALPLSPAVVERMRRIRDLLARLARSESREGADG